MSINLTINHEIQKMLKDRGLMTGKIDGKLDIVAVEHLMFQMGINYAGWSTERKLIAAEELFYETQGIDVGTVDGLDDHYIQHAREVYKAKLTTTWRDKVEEIARENAPPDTSGSPWAAKYTLTQKALGISAKQYDGYREAVGHIESRNNPDQGAGGAGGHYFGMYQFGTAATETTSAFLKDSISKEDFEGNQDLAEKHFDALSYLNHKALSKTEEYNKLTPTKKLAVLGYAHNQGAGGARKWLQTGVEGKDGFGTSGKKYYDAILKAIKEIPEEPVSKMIFIGDSVAVGLGKYNKLPYYAEVGASPKKILSIVTDNYSNLNGKIAVLSAGLLNNITDTANVEAVIRVLKETCSQVILVGGPSKETARPDLAKVNEILESIGSREGIKFLGEYQSKDGVHPESYATYLIRTESLPVIPKKVVEPTKESKKFSLRDINLNQLKFIRGIGQTETGFSKKEAYSEQYNQKSNNRNVREYGQKGADYGYYQCNELDVAHAIRVGVNPEIAKHLNGSGKGGKSSVAQQTLAMHEYISRVYPKVYNKLTSGKLEDWQNAIDAMDGKWFGLKDRPEESKKIWMSKVTVENLFPEVAFSVSEQSKNVEVAKKPTIVSVPKRTFSWPKQGNCEDFYGKVGTSQVKCQLPFQMVLAWDKGTKLTSYSCHKLVKEPMERIWNRVYEHYGYSKIVELRLHMFGGCLNVRKMRGGSSWSMHSWGIAVDIDPVRNALHTTWKNAQMSKPEYEKFVQFWYDEGAINLGKERDFDAMHFQFSTLD